MRGVDTNVLVRYFTADHPVQLALSHKALEESERDGEPLFVAVIVLCELIWVLARTYGHKKPAIAHALSLMLEMDLFQIEHHELVRRALDAYRSGRGNFSDYMIREINMHYGCRDVVTFDLALKGSAGFKVLG